MIERAIENWLIKANEKSFQLPFSYILSNQGHTVVHVSRHCGMELGKDILTIGPDGIPCAFQLKSGDISLHKWNTELIHQVQNLVLGTIVHPSIDSSKQYRAYLVTNGKIEEEVSRAIEDLNRQWQRNNQPQLKVIVGQEIIRDAIVLQTNFWPFEPSDMKSILELYIEDGRDIFPKSKFANLLEATLPLYRTSKGKKPTKNECNRAIASAAILTSFVTSNFLKENNHLALIEAWTIYISYILALSEKWKLISKYFNDELAIALMEIYNSLLNLAHELKSRNHYLEENISVDGPFYQIRMTWLISLLSILGLWNIIDKIDDKEINDFIHDFCKKNFNKTIPWGEAAIPQYLAFYWYFRFINATLEPEIILRDLIELLCTRNSPNSVSPLPDPYYEAKDLLPYIIDSQIDQFLPHKYRISEEPIRESFVGESFTLEGLIYLYVRGNWKQNMKRMWPKITKIRFHSFQFDKLWHFYLWRISAGEDKETLPNHTQSWEKLKILSNDSCDSDLPDLIKKIPIFLLLLICVFPHRYSASVIRWLDSQLKKIRHHL